MLSQSMMSIDLVLDLTLFLQLLRLEKRKKHIEPDPVILATP